MSASQTSVSQAMSFVPTLLERINLAEKPRALKEQKTNDAWDMPSCWGVPLPHQKLARPTRIAFFNQLDRLQNTYISMTGYLFLDFMSIKLDTIVVSDQFCERYMPIRSGPSLPLPVARALRKLGADLRDARRRRRIATTTMAVRASISRTTLGKIERGDPGVQLGHYATVLFVLGLTDRIGDLADVRHDKTGLELDEERLPQRIRFRAPKPTAKKKA